MRRWSPIAVCLAGAVISSSCSSSSGNALVGEHTSSGGAGGSGGSAGSVTNEGGGSGSGGGGGSGVVPQGCTLGDKVAFTTLENPLMDPGMTCLRCHAQNFGPSQFAAGTVYFMPHEPDLCVGADGTKGELAGLHVSFTDSTGMTLDAPVRENGNFYLSMTKQFVPPYTARIVRADGVASEMMGAQTDGDCNSCHSAEGHGNGSAATGRLTVP